MRKQHFKLRRPDLNAQLEERYRQEKDARKKVRLLAMRLGASGGHASQDIADICGVSRATFFERARSFREGGFESLLEREKPGPKGLELRGDPEAVVKELRAGVESGRWATAESARIWLEREHGIKRPDVTVWSWLKKLGGVPEGAASETPRKCSRGSG